MKKKMACTMIPFLAMAAAITQVSGVPSYGGFLPGLIGFPAGGYEPKPLLLTCAVNFTDYHKKDIGIVNMISVTIKEKTAPYGGMKSSLFSYVGYAGMTGSGLTATIDIFSAIGGPVSIAFTERAKFEKGCFPEDFGSFLTPKSSHSGVTIGGYGGYGTYPGYSGYGSGSYGGYAYGGGLGGFGGLYGAGYGSFAPNGYGGDDAPGVVAKVTLTPGTAASINIDSLDGFSHLKELAGRGVVVCPTKSVEAGYHGAQCEGGILSCCALHYDQGEQRVSATRYDSY